MWRGSGDLVATRDASPLNVNVASGDHSPPCALFYLVIVIVQHWSCYSDHTSSVDRLQLTHTPGRHLAPSQAVSRSSTLPQHPARVQDLRTQKQTDHGLTAPYEIATIAAPK